MDGAGWKERLTDLIRALGQEPLEDVVLQMDLMGTEEEQCLWLKTLDSAITAAVHGDPSVVEIINSGGGYLASTPSEALRFFQEIGELYQREIARRLED